MVYHVYYSHVSLYTYVFVIIIIVRFICIFGSLIERLIRSLLQCAAKCKLF